MSDTLSSLIDDLARVDARVMAWGVCCCARAALALAPSEDPHPREKLAHAEGWLRHGADPQPLPEARARLPGVCGSYEVPPALHTPYAIGSAVQATAQVSRGEIQGARSSANEAAEHACMALHGADAAEDAKIRGWAAELDDPYDLHVLWFFALASSQRVLRDRIRAERWPKAVPSPAQLQGASSSLCVAWDRVASAPGDDQTIAALLAAHARAGRLGLDWHDPVQRAIAERTKGGAWLRALLGTARRDR